MSRLFGRWFSRLAILVLVATWEARFLISAKALIYRHDWTWPGPVQQLIASRMLNAAPWISDGLGSAAIAPLHHPLFMAWTLGGVTLGTHVTLIATVILALTVFGAGIASCVRGLWRLPELMALALGLVAMMGPPLLNKLVAGHLYYLVSLSTVPWVIRMLAVPSGRAKLAFLAASALVAFAILQIQLYIVLIAVLIIAVIFKKDVPLWIRSIGVSAALLQLAPEIWAVIGKDPQLADAWMVPRRAWEFNNSAPFPQGLYFLGYSPHYAENAMRRVGISRESVGAMQAGIALALVAVFIHRRRIVAWLLALGWIVCTLLVLGLYGPFGVPLGFLFAHVAAFAVFRELYHFAGVGWTFEVILIGGVWQLRRMRWPVAIFAALTIALFGAMWSPSAFAGQIASSDIPLSIQHRLASLREDKSDGRFLLWPAEWPVGPTSSGSAGADPLAYPVGSHPVANAYRLSGPLEVAAGFVREGQQATADRWLAAAGVDTVINERWTSARIFDRAPPTLHLASWMRPFVARAASTARPSSILRQTCVLCAYKYLPIISEPEQWKSGDAFVLRRDLEPHPPTSCRPQASFSAADPSTAWVDLLDWSWLDPRLAMMRSGVVTWSTAPLVAPVCQVRVGAVHVLLLAGHLSVNGRLVNVGIGSPTWLRLPSTSSVLQVHAGLAAVDDFAPAIPTMPRNFSAASKAVPLAFDWRSGTGGGRVESQERWIVFKSTFSTHWKIRVVGGDVLAHIRASGYANAWEIHAPRGAQIYLWYDRWASTEVLAWAAVVAWFTMIFCIIWLRATDGSLDSLFGNFAGKRHHRLEPPFPADFTKEDPH
mgnify:CR=1 FL=1